MGGGIPTDRVPSRTLSGLSDRAGDGIIASASRRVKGPVSVALDQSRRR